MSCKKHILAQLRRLRDQPSQDNLPRSLLHAYVACLTTKELCEAAFKSLSQEDNLPPEYRSRLLRLAQQDNVLEQLEDLVCKIAGSNFAHSNTRRKADSLISALYIFLRAPIRQMLLERWKDQGTRSGDSRWLKAITSDELLFDIEQIIDYWKRTFDWRAAKIIAYRADRKVLDLTLRDLIEHCEQGWIIGAAAKRASALPEELWAEIQEKFPATYLYLCAAKSRDVDDRQALKLILRSDDGLLGNRGLAIWAVGQLGMVRVLDEVCDHAREIRKKDLKQLGISPELFDEQDLDFV